MVATTQSKTQMSASTRRHVITAGALAVGSLAIRPATALAESIAGISHSAESKEPTFKASRKRVYDALTSTKQFEKVTQSSGVMKSMTQMTKPTEISPHVGGAFALFGGYIVGRHIELVPNELIVQAWRVGSWDRGVYSIVRFELTDQGTGTKILLDHAGFPKGLAEHLAEGWQAHYWDPLAAVLA